MNQALIHVYLMPGMAASPLIFEYIKLPEDQFKIHYLEWVLPNPKENLQDYAYRMSKKVMHDQAVLIGVSFGGVLVQEMSKFLETKKIINKLNSNITFFDNLITNDNLGKDALKYFENNKCKKFIVIQSTFTDSKFISLFVKKFKKPILFISFKERRAGGRLRLNSLCGVNLGLHSLIKNKFYSNFIIYFNNADHFSKEILRFINNNNNFPKKNYLKKTCFIPARYN